MAYGFEIRNADDEVVLDSTDTTMRVVHTMYLPYNATTVETVPQFDINNGTFYFRAHLTAVRALLPRVYYDSVSDRDFSFPSVLAGYRAYPGVNNVPVMNWNNTTKVMNATTPESRDVPTGSSRVPIELRYAPAIDGIQGQIVFLEYI